MGIAVNIAIFAFYYLSSSYFWFSYEFDIKTQAFIWTFLYFILECFSLLLYFCDKKSTGEDDISELSSFEGDSKRKEETDLFGNDHMNIINQTTKPYVGIKRLSFILPAFLDMISKLLLFISYEAGNACLLQPLFSVVITWIISIIIAKKTKLKKSSINLQTHIGCIFYIIGLIMIIIPNFDMSSINKVLLILSLLGEIAKITHYFIQNWYIYPDNGTKSYLEVFYEGIFGTIMSGILVLIFSFVQCSQQSYDYFFCFPPEKIVNFSRFSSQVKSNGFICFPIFLSYLLYNITGVYTIEKSNVMNRMLIDNLHFCIIKILKDTMESRLNLSWLIYVGAGIMLISTIITCQICSFPCIKERRDSIDSQMRKLNPKELYLGETTQ